jgi:hypothetical protein
LYIIQIRFSNNSWVDNLQTFDYEEAKEEKGKMEKQNYNVRIVEIVKEVED